VQTRPANRTQDGKNGDREGTDGEHRSKIKERLKISTLHAAPPRLELAMLRSEQKAGVTPQSAGIRITP